MNGPLHHPGPIHRRSSSQVADENEIHTPPSAIVIRSDSGNEKADRAAKSGAKGTESVAVNIDLGLADIYSRLTVQVWRQWGGGGGGGFPQPGTGQRVGRSDSDRHIPLQGPDLLYRGADTRCTHHAPYTHGLVEGHVHTRTCLCGNPAQA